MFGVEWVVWFLLWMSFALSADVMVVDWQCLLFNIAKLLQCSTIYSLVMQPF